MKKKNTLPIIWMLGILIILMGVAFWTTQQTKSMNQGVLPAASNVSSQKKFLQFLSNMIGIRNQGPASSETSKENNILNQNNPTSFGQMGAANTSKSQGSTTAQQGNNSGNNPEIDALNNPGNNPGDNLGTNAQNNPWNLSANSAKNNPGSNAEVVESTPGNNPAINSENSPNNNLVNNPEINSEINSENNPANNTGNNSENNAGSNSGNNAGSNTGGNTGGNSGNTSDTGCIPGCYPGCIPGCNAECIPPTCLLGDINVTNLPTINPIPSDGDVAQNIAAQNQQNDALNQLLATRESMVIPAQQQAQASKYQTVNSDNIPAPSTSPVSADIQAKVKAKQLTFH